MGRTLMDTLGNLFGGGAPSPAPAPAMAVPGAQNLDPRVMQLLQQMGLQAPDPADEKRRAIASALAKGGQHLATAPVDFGQALAGAVGAGATDYTGTREKQAEDKRKSNLDILKQMFGLEKLDQSNDLRWAIEGMKDKDRDSRTDIMLGRLEELARHNKTTEGTAANNAATSAGRAAEAGRHNLATEDISRGKKPAGASENYFLDAQRVETAKNQKRRGLGLDGDKATVFKIMDPEGYAKAVTEYDKFSTEQDARLGAKYPNATAQPVPQPKEAKNPVGTKGTGSSRNDPVSNITSKQEFDSLPSGAWFINPKDGKPYRKK
jgi:hypothetical protein